MLLNNTSRVALCGVLTALCTVLMFATGLIPVATYALPALSGVLLMVIVMEIGKSWAWAVYGAVSLLSLLLAADKEAVFLFIVFLGYYPILKASIEQLKKKAWAYVLKLAVFNTAMVAGFFMSVYLLAIPEESFTIFGIYLPGVFLAAGNLVFLVYDYALSGLVLLYYSRLHKMVSGLFKKR